MPGHHPIQCGFCQFRRKTSIYFYGQDLSAKVVDYIERPETTNAKRAVTHKIDGPASINRIGYGQVNRATIGKSLLAAAQLI